MSKRTSRGARPGAARSSAGRRKEPPGGGFRFGPANWAAMAAGLASIVLGYVFLDGGSVTAAPLLLVLGYVVLLPLGIVLGWRRLD